jgi:hypothetical protein
MRLCRLLWVFGRVRKSCPAERTFIHLLCLPEPAVKALLMEDMAAGKWADIVLILDLLEADSTK